MDERDQRRAVAKMLLSFTLWAGANFTGSVFNAAGNSQLGGVFGTLAVVFGAWVIVGPMLSCGFGK